MHNGITEKGFVVSSEVSARVSRALERNQTFKTRAPVIFRLYRFLSRFRALFDAARTVSSRVFINFWRQSLALVPSPEYEVLSFFLECTRRPSGEP